MQHHYELAGMPPQHNGKVFRGLIALLRNTAEDQTLASFDAAGTIFPSTKLFPSSTSRRVPAQGNGRRMQNLRAELLTAWSAVIDEGATSGTYTLGKAVQQFERIVEDAWTTPDTDPLHAVMVNSGTTALYGALVACGIKPGDYVIVPAMTFVSTALACAWVGATPIFVDITPGTWTLSLDAARHLLADRADLRPRIRRSSRCICMEPSCQTWRNWRNWCARKAGRSLRMLPRRTEPPSLWMENGISPGR